MTKALKSSIKKLSPKKKWKEISNQYINQGKIFVKCLSIQQPALLSNSDCSSCWCLYIIMGLTKTNRNNRDKG